MLTTGTRIMSSKLLKILSVPFFIAAVITLFMLNSDNPCHQGTYFAPCGWGLSAIINSAAGVIQYIVAAIAASVVGAPGMLLLHIAEKSKKNRHQHSFARMEDVE